MCHNDAIVTESPDEEAAIDTLPDTECNRGENHTCQGQGASKGSQGNAQGGSTKRNRNSGRLQPLPSNQRRQGNTRSPQPSLPSLTIHSPRSIHPSRFLHSHPHLTIKTDSSPPVLKRHHPSLPPFITIPPLPALYLTIRTASHHPQSAAPSSASSRVQIAREDRIMWYQSQL
ncbi:unnamed protein product [Cochlearia groenlandica]